MHKKPIFRRLLEGLIASPFIIGVAWVFLGAARDSERLRRIFTNAHYSALVENCKDEILRVYETEVDGRKASVVFIRATSSFSEACLSSGSPVMVFDEDGKLIDKTVDSGNDFKFYNKWIKPIASRHCEEQSGETETADKSGADTRFDNPRKFERLEVLAI